MTLSRHFVSLLPLMPLPFPMAYDCLPLKSCPYFQDFKCHSSRKPLELPQLDTHLPWYRLPQKTCVSSYFLSCLVISLHVIYLLDYSLTKRKRENKAKKQWFILSLIFVSPEELKTLEHIMHIYCTWFEQKSSYSGNEKGIIHCLWKLSINSHFDMVSDFYAGKI